jgi:signal transduction histidine kinase
MAEYGSTVAAVGGHEWPNLLLAAAELGLALVVLRYLWRFGRSFPWLGALMVYFAFRGSVRLDAALTGRESATLAVTSDVLLVVVLLLTTAGIGRTVRALHLALDDARVRAAEYDRARRDLERLTRHRVANPLMVLGGGIATLRAHRATLADEKTDALLASMEQAVARLERLSVDPEYLGPEEHELAPVPAALDA